MPGFFIHLPNNFTDNLPFVVILADLMPGLFMHDSKAANSESLSGLSQGGKDKQSTRAHAAIRKSDPKSVSRTPMSDGHGFHTTCLDSVSYGNQFP